MKKKSLFPVYKFKCKKKTLFIGCVGWKVGIYPEQAPRFRLQIKSDAVFFFLERHNIPQPGKIASSATASRRKGGSSSICLVLSRGIRRWSFFFRILLHPLPPPSRRHRFFFPWRLCMRRFIVYIWWFILCFIMYDVLYTVLLWGIFCMEAFYIFLHERFFSYLFLLCEDFFYLFLPGVFYLFILQEVFYDVPI